MRAVLIGVVLTAAACQQRAPADNASATLVAPATFRANAQRAPTPAGTHEEAPTSTGVVATPASYDWTYATHGGSGELVFGDGDTAEGESLLTLSCLPGSNAMQASGFGDGDAELRAGEIGIGISEGSSVPIGHPVIRALNASGTVELVRGSERRALTAKPGAGRIAIESFLAYCAAS